MEKRERSPGFKKIPKAVAAILAQGDELVTVFGPLIGQRKQNDDLDDSGWVDTL